MTINRDCHHEFRKLVVLIIKESMNQDISDEKFYGYLVIMFESLMHEVHQDISVAATCLYILHTIGSLDVPNISEGMLESYFN